ncbi:MAG: glycosyltransferase family 39 protein [Cyanobacteria bacterium SZAS-4]|nr:glycosyltransferase family 39 protein [Cyanobacteria bacterium SZAS-4]
MRNSPKLLFCMVLAALALGAVYAWLVHAGMPGDEPAHYQNVAFYQQNWCMPVLGQPGVNYEGQMGPVYYYCAAPIFGIFKLLGGVQVGFYATRFSGLLLIPIMVLLTYLIVQRAYPRSEQVALATTAFMALNPSLLSIFSSVQNDALSVVLAMSTLLLSYYFFENSKDLVKKGVILGILVSAGILTKATVIYLAASVPIYALLRLRRKSWSFNIPFVITVILLSAWFFIRNYILYGDISAQAGLTKFGFTNNPPPTNLTKLHELKHWLWVIETYYWLPIQYYRDWFHAPIWLRAMVGIFTAVGFVGAFKWARKLLVQKFPGDSAQKHFVLFLIIQYLSCMAIYTYSCMRITHFAPRVTFPCMITYAMVIGLGAVCLGPEQRAQQKYTYGLIAALLVMNAFVLWSAVHIVMPWQLFEPGS